MSTERKSIGDYLNEPIAGTYAVSAGEAPEVAPMHAPGVLMGDPEAGDAFVTVTDGMAELPEGTDVKRIAASIDLLSHTGYTDAEIAFDDERESNKAWSARVLDPNGVEEITRGWFSPEVAIERLARRLLNGGRCAHCGRVTSIGAFIGESRNRQYDTYCIWERFGTQYVRGCRETHQEYQATTEAVAAGENRDEALSRGPW